MRVHIERVTAQKSDQGLPDFAGEFDRQTRWRGDRANDGDSRGQRLLHDFKRGPPADQEDVFVERQTTADETVPNDLVNGVVTAYVFTNDNKVSLSVEHCRRVQPTCALEGFLSRLELFHESKDGSRGDSGCCRNRRKMLLDRLDRSLAAKTTTGRCEDVASQPVKTHFHCGGQKNVQSVLAIDRFAAPTMRDFHHVAALANQSFRQ